MALDTSELLEYDLIKQALNETKYKVVSESLIDNLSFIAHVKEATISGEMLIFHRMNFSEINLSNFILAIPIIFYDCVFDNILKFTACDFLYPIFFHSVKFNSSAKFKLSQFNNSVSFINVEFNEEVSFERVKFLATNIKYLKRKLFDINIIFPKLFYSRNKVDFLGTIFQKEVSFINSNFGCSLLFSSYKNNQTIFYNEADFSCIVDEKESLIMDSKDLTIHKEVEIALDSFHKISFQSTKFYGEANFENRIFQKKTSFNNSFFFKAPKFHNCTLHQDTDFRGSDFLDTYSEDSEHAYRTLKLIMDKKQARREEGMFFALEQKSMLNSSIRIYNIPVINNIRLLINNFIVRYISKNQPNKIIYKNTPSLGGFSVSLTEKIISFIYLILSNYGQSIKRPFIILITNVFITFPLCYFFFASNTKIINNKLSNAYHFSFQQLFRPFDIYTIKFSLYYDQLPVFIYIIATLESVTNMGLLTLLLLAIRGKFKRY